MIIYNNNIQENYSISEFKKVAFLSAFLLIPIVVLILLNALTLEVLVIYALIPIAFIFILNFNVMFSLFLITFFFEFTILSFSISELFAIFLLISFLITHQFPISELKNVFLISFLIFLVSIIPSIINSEIPILSAFLSLRLILFLFMFLILSIYFKDRKSIWYLIIIFISLSFSNAVYLIADAVINNKRSFGYTGIMYVDLVGLSLVITTILFLYFKKFRITFFTLTIIFLLALLFTQTRNSWITSALVVMGIGIQYFIRSIKEGISLAALMFKVFIFLIPVFLVVIQISQSDIAVFERANVSALSQTRDTEEYMKTAGSFITRIFIWDTTINAFLANPVTGIGFYTFPFLSKSYSQLDPELYKLFVEGLPPHQTYLAMLGETGIIGFVGFIIFISVILITSFRNMKLAKVGSEKLFATLSFWLFFYVLISMIMTDAWLWGTLFMVFSVIIALIDSNSRMILKS